MKQHDVKLGPSKHTMLVCRLHSKLISLSWYSLTEVQKPVFSALNAILTAARNNSCTYHLVIPQITALSSSSRTIHTQTSVVYKHI